MSGTINGNPPTSIFGDPSTGALLGMAQGFSAAAMPSRMPVPFGAALGMGASGAMQGAQQAQQYQAADLANQMTRMRMPAYAALGAKMAYGSGMPFGVPQQQPGGGVGHWIGRQLGILPPAAQASAAAPAVMNSPPSSPAGAAPPPGSPSYVMSPQDLYGRGDMAMFLGQDRAASSLYGNAQQEAGGIGYAAGPGGRSFAVPGGPSDPVVKQTLAYADASGTGAGGLASKEAQAAFQSGLDVNAYGAKAQIDTQQAGPRRAAENNADAPYQPPISITQMQPDGTYHTVAIPRPAWAAQNGAGADGTPTPGTILASSYAQRVQASENATGNPGAGNPRSSAAGNGQFLGGTFLPLFRQTFPQMANMPDDQVLAMRSNPDLSNVMTLAYARQNAPILQRAGLPVTAGTLGLAHQFGPGGATKLLQADPGAPASNVLPPDVIQANPALSQQTVGNVVQSANMRFGYSPVDGIGGGSGAGGIVGKPDMTPEQEVVSRAYGAQAGAIEESGAKAPQTLQLLDTLDNAARQFRTGSTGELRLAGGKALVDGLQALGITPPDGLLTGVGSGEAINKAGGFLASAMTRQLGSREAAAVFNQVKSFNPNIEQTPQGFQVITNSVRQGVQRDVDLRDYQRQWITDPSHSGSIAGMQQAFEASHPIAAYASRVIPFAMPASAGAAVPNVVYSTARGPALWDGRQFTAIPAQ